jgi:hypothetical protein
VAKWLLDKWLQIVNYSATSDKGFDRLPPDWWWVILAGVQAITEYVNVTFVKLQGRSLLVSEQAAELTKLGGDLAIHVGIQGPFYSPVEFQEATELADGRVSMYGRWLIPHARVIEFLNDQGMYIRHTLDTLNDEWHEKVVTETGKLLVTIVDQIMEIKAERDTQNQPADDLPAVLPHELVKVRTAVFGKTIVDRHLQQLRQSWDEERITKIEEQHRQLCIAYQREDALRSALDKCGAKPVSFEAGWAIVRGRYDVLRDFCGGIATVPANTATVESDFSVLGWEKDEHRMCLSDLALEGIMQSKQFELLSNLFDLQNNR